MNMPKMPKNDEEMIAVLFAVVVILMKEKFSDRSIEAMNAAFDSWKTHRTIN